jgi:hypothetical protein
LCFVQVDLGVYGFIAYRDKESCRCLCAFFVRRFAVEASTKYCGDDWSPSAMHVRVDRLLHEGDSLPPRTTAVQEACSETLQQTQVCSRIMRGEG